jgi:hypothetical protein
VRPARPIRAVARGAHQGLGDASRPGPPRTNPILMARLAFPVPDGEHSGCCAERVRTLVILAEAVPEGLPRTTARACR